MNTTPLRASLSMGLGVALTLGVTNVASSAPLDGESSKYEYEITPYFGYQSGGDFTIEDTDEEGDVASHTSYALAMNFRADNDGQYQVFYSRQPTHVEDLDVDIDYVHFGGTLRVDPGSKLEPYILGSVGATVLSPHFPTADNKSVFSVGLGAGLRVPVRPQFSLLLEARAFFSFLPSGGALFCSSGETGGACRLQGSGSVFTQYTVMAGAAFSF